MGSNRSNMSTGVWTPSGHGPQKVLNMSKIGFWRCLSSWAQSDGILMIPYPKSPLGSLRYQLCWCRPQYHSEGLEELYWTTVRSYGAGMHCITVLDLLQQDPTPRDRDLNGSHAVGVLQLPVRATPLQWSGESS